MPSLRLFVYTIQIIFITFIILCIGCASVPVPERAPKDQRLSIRQLNRGTRYYNKGCFSKAAQHFQNAHERFSAVDDLQGTADSLNSLANAYYRLNDLQSAVLVYDEADALYAQLNDKIGRVRALTNKSVTLTASDNLNAAKIALDMADALAGDDDGSNGSIGIRLKARAILKLKSHDADSAEMLLEKALSEIPSSNPRQYASAQYAMGYLLLTIEKPNRAIKYLARALNGDRTTGDHFGIGQDLEALGDCHTQLKQHAQAVVHYKRSIKIYALLNNIEKVQIVSSKLVQSASESGINPKATLQWAAQWLSGVTESNICR